MSLHSYAKHLATLRLSPNTIRLRLHYVRAYITRHDPDHATPAKITHWLNSHNWSDHTRQAALASLKSYFRWLTETGNRPDNPTDLVEPVRVKRKRARIASDLAIMEGLMRAERPRERAWILLGAECGLRVHEIAKVRADEIDGNWLTVTGKGGHIRLVWLSDRLRDLLATFEPRHGFLFPGRSGKPVHTSTIWRAMRDLVHINPHALRHRAGTTVYKGTGNDIRVAQVFLGHASPTTTAIYLHVTDDDLQVAGGIAEIAA